MSYSLCAILKCGAAVDALVRGRDKMKYAPPSMSLPWLCVTCAMSAARVLKDAPQHVPSPRTMVHENDGDGFSHVFSLSNSAGTASASDAGGLHTDAAKAVRKARGSKAKK